MSLDLVCCSLSRSWQGFAGHQDSSGVTQQLLPKLRNNQAKSSKIRIAPRRIQQTRLSGIRVFRAASVEQETLYSKFSPAPHRESLRPGHDIPAPVCAVPSAAHWRDCWVRVGRNSNYALTSAASRKKPCSPFRPSWPLHVACSAWLKSLFTHHSRPKEKSNFGIARL